MTELAPPISLLLVEDDPLLRASLERGLRREGFAVLACEDLAAARALLDHQHVDALLVDFELPDGTGADLVHAALAARRTAVAYCMTGLAACPRVVEAMRAGCADVFEKPLDVERFAAHLRTRHAAFSHELDDLHAFRARFAPAIIGNHPSLLEVLRVVRNIAETDCTALLSGESGTGKELVARALHQASPRADGPFVAINCAAIPETLIEDELFGHARGAFTSASGPRDGRFAAARGGVLFLDEIGDMPLPAQAKLLRVLQERVIIPVGADRPIPIDVRVIAATNKSLEQQVERGLFRGDLFFRLRVIPITLPPLRERAEDILPLAHFLLDQANRTHHRHITGIDPLAEEALLAHRWPGNVRELAHAIERAVVLRRHGRIVESDLHLPPRHGFSLSAGETLNLRLAVYEVERRLIEQALLRTQGNRTEAAALLGLNRTTLVDKLRKFA